MATKAHRHSGRLKPKPILKHDFKHYLPYLPMLVMLAILLISSFVQPFIKQHVLAYSTSMSSDALLSATNKQREGNGVADLNINGNLAAAAQAKANDMVKRNYWSHNTPDGQEPWVFIQATGYKYYKAGENLAYGFDNSEDTVTGWMNSPEHKANLLDSAFSDVGFGYANSDNFNSDGPETVVVALYGKPQVLASSQAAPAASKPAAPTPVSTQPTPQPTANPQIATAQNIKPTTTENTVKDPPTQPIARIQNLSGGKLPWAAFGAGILCGIGVAILLVKHAVRLRHLLRDSRRFVLHHPLLDSMLITLVLLGIYMSQTTGFIR